MYLLSKKMFTLMQKYIKVIYKTVFIKVNKSSEKVRIIESLSTLKNLDHCSTSDDFLKQTKIRISSHIAEKGLDDDLPDYTYHVRALRKELLEYNGAETESIKWARKILKLYMAKNGLQ